MPATGTPEPGGLMGGRTTVIKKVCQISNVVGIDINELAPIKNFNTYNFIVAKLAYTFYLMYLNSNVRLHIYYTPQNIYWSPT